MATLENPLNGNRVRVTWLSFVGALVFGIFWFAFNGLWKHVFIQLIAIAILFRVPINFGALMLLVLMWQLYALLAHDILMNSYLSRGWRKVR